MDIIERLRVAFRAFKAAKALAARGDYGMEQPPPATYGNYFSTSAAVYRCIMLRATNMARPRMRVYREHNGQVEELFGHELGKLLQKVNPFWTGKQLWRATEADLCWYGNAYWAIEGTGKPFELWRMRPDWVKVVPDPTNYIKGYLYTVDAVEYPFDAKQVIHFRYTDPFNEYYGMSPARAAQYSIEMGTEGVKYNRHFFRNLAMPALALSTEQALAPTTAQELLEKWNEALQGPLKAGKTAILHSGLKPAPLTVTQKDAEWFNALKWSLEDTARVYGVPAPLVGEERAVYKNIVEAEAALWHETLLPELDWMVDLLNVKLAPRYGPDIVIMPDLSAVEALQDDMLNLTQRYATLMEKAAVTINEARARLHLGADVPWGKQAWIAMHYMPVSTPRPELSAPKEETAGEGEKPETGGGGSTESGGGGDAPKKAVSGPNRRATRDLAGVWVGFRDYDARTVNYLSGTIEAFFAREAPKIADAAAVEQRQAGYDWGTWERELTPPVAKHTQDQCESAAKDAFDSVTIKGTFNLQNIRASEWASRNAAEQIKRVEDATKARVNTIVTGATKEGLARDRIRDLIIQDPIFDKRRAVLIARTETERAYNQGNLRGYRESGQVDAKAWIGAADCCGECVLNAEQQFIDLEANFVSGDEAPPAHPNCRCRIIPRIRVPEGEPPPPAEFNPKIVDKGWSKEELDLFRSYSKLDPAEYRVFASAMEHADHCPVILTNPALKRHGFNYPARYIASRRPAGVYFNSMERCFVVPKYRSYALNHEVIHHYHRVVLEKAGSPKAVQIRQLYGEAKVRGSAVTNYALKNEYEYMAESMDAFMKTPMTLRAADSAMYEFLNTKILRGYYT